MRRILSFSITALLFFSCLLPLCGCGNSGEDAPGTADVSQASSTARTDEKAGGGLSDTTDVYDAQTDPDASRASSDARAFDLAGAKTSGADKKNPTEEGGASGSLSGGSGSSLGGGSQGSTGGTPGSASPSAAGALQVIGTQLCDGAGNPVQLRGISTHGLAWFPDYVNDACFSELKNQWNANVIRLAMYTAEYGGYCSGGSQSDLKKLVKNGIRYAASQDLYVIVDWHILSDNNPNTHKEEAKAFFDEISSEFSGSTHILYEICNEPNGGTSWSDIKSYALEVIPVIRANDPDAVIIVGTPNWSQFVDQAAADPISEYDNLMYALHFYAATHKDDLRGKMSAAVSKGLPVFVTEYGICDASGNGGLDIDQANQWVAAMDQCGVSYVAWNLSNKSESSAILKSSCSKTSGFTQEDLSDSGKWLFQMLTSGNGSLGAGADGNNTGSGTPGGNAADGGSQSGDSAVGGQQGDNSAGGGQQGGASTSGGQQGGDSNSQTAITNDNGIQVTASIINSWENGGVPYYQYTLSLKNTTNADCQSWSLHLSCESGMSLSDSWNGDYTVEGGTLTITAKDYNGWIPAGGSIDNIGFIVCGGKLL